MQKYPISSRVLHWLMAILIIFMLPFGIYMTDFVAKDAPNRLEIYGLHKSLGVVVLILAFLRIVNRFIVKAPSLPQSMPKIEKILANIGHLVLYLLMILIPLSGYLMSNSAGYPVHLFAIEMPKIIETNFENAGFFKELHELSAFVMIAVLALHVIAVIKHRFFDKAENDVLKRMI